MSSTNTNAPVAEKKRGAERTQKAVRDEDWSDERLAGFLDILPPDDISADYNCLLRAYRGMTAELFARFLPLFVNAGRDINAPLANGSTFLDHVAGHRRSGDYAAALIANGAVAKLSLGKPA